MIKENFIDNPLREYLLETNQGNENNMFNCANCTDKFIVKYDENNLPITLWCDKCRLTENKIKKQFKMENSSQNPINKEDPYVSLAQMKVLLDRTKTYWKGKTIINSLSMPTANAVLVDIDKILSKAKIPSKYLIAESLD